MPLTSMLARWRTALAQSHDRPTYLMIADIIAEEINSGALQPRDRLPPLRDLAEAVNINYTTAARGYSEARSRGLIDSRPGMGTFIKGRSVSVPLSGGSSFEMTMNLPTEPAIPGLTEQIRAGAFNLFAHRDMYSLFRYQDFGGSEQDKEAGVMWLGRALKQAQVDNVLVCPGIHSALVALLSQLVTDGGMICACTLVYPGLKAIAAQLNLSIYALECDNDGPVVRAFEDACKTGNVRAFYINPTLQNPTTITIPLRRREALADVALRYSIPIIEDDAYAALASKPLTSMAELAPELTYYVTGLSKCFGAGLRIAYLHAPNPRLAKRIAGALRALTVMSSPITNGLATQWIMEGTADAMLKAIRSEARARQQRAARHLAAFDFKASPDGFHLWLTLPKGVDWNPAHLAAHLRSQRLGAVSSAAFCTDNNPPNALRLCLGGSSTLQQCEESLMLMADILEHPSHLSGLVL
ncbi:PLP-dependent aminotransferase family protein [Pokkaliibacter plantistimulans]|nr:PLP-dependent aminotransferase family protein [Pokkaliibacter plantistimulans]